MGLENEKKMAEEKYEARGCPVFSTWETLSTVQLINKQMDV